MDHRLAARPRIARPQRSGRFNSALIAWMVGSTFAISHGAPPPRAVESGITPGDAADDDATAPHRNPGDRDSPGGHPSGRPPDPRWSGPSTRPMPPPDGAIRLAEEHAVWVHQGRKEVLVDGRIVLNRGPLEMFACPPDTKEHESIVAVESKAYLLHAGLLAIGARQGRPVQFVPNYEPARGSQIQVDVLWVDAKGELRRADAQSFIRDSNTGRPLDVPWVFAGSSFWVNPEGERKYLAESGDLICVSNFTTAMLDLPIESSQAEAQLLFEANPATVPVPGTRVRLILSVK